MAHLPEEMAISIIKNLKSLEDRKAASAVCRQWNRAFQDKYFRQLEVVHIWHYRQFNDILDSECTDYENFIITNTHIDENSYRFWDTYGANIKSLELNKCYLNEKMFYIIIGRSTNLETLIIRDCKELFMTGFFANDQLDEQDSMALKNLKTLGLEDNSYLTDFILIKLLTMCPNLTALSLSGSQISYHRGLFRKFYPHGLESSSDAVTTFQKLLHYVVTRKVNLKSLDISNTLIDSDSLESFSQLGLNIEKLYLRNCNQLNHEGIMRSSNGWNGLVHLDFSNCKRLNDRALLMIGQNMPALQRLNLTACVDLTDVGFYSISNFEHLKYLNISECSITGETLVKDICSNTMEKIQHLHLKGLRRMREETLVRLSKRCPKLITLDVSFCRNAVTDVALQFILSQLTKLETLDVEMCQEISNEGIIPHGRRLHYNFPPDEDGKFRGEELWQKEDDGYFHSAPANIRKFNLGGCYRITDMTIECVFPSLVLENVDLSFTSITNDGVYHLVKNCPHIQKINLKKCEIITDKAVEYLIHALPRLRSLSVGNGRITENIIECIERSGNKLVYLDISDCVKIPGLKVCDLQEKLPRLRTFHFPHCTKSDVQMTLIPTPPAPRFLNIF